MRTTSAGVVRQDSGTVVWIENPPGRVFLAYASPTGRVLMELELYLPRTWTKNGQRCQGPGIDDEVKLATKPETEQLMIERALDADIPRRVPDVLWEIAESLLPGLRPRLRKAAGRPQTIGRRSPRSSTYSLAAASGGTCRRRSGGGSVATAHRCLATWAKAAVVDELHRQVLDRLGVGWGLDWPAATGDESAVWPDRPALIRDL
ncbi:hypothetical protein HND73_25190 [Rhodococcus ruber]|nr:hypothetical protein [Rhodococcus ruber]